MSPDAKFERQAQTEGYESAALKGRGVRGKKVRRAFKKVARNAIARRDYREARNTRDAR